MLPVLFTVGGLSISSFGFLLAVGFLLSIFTLWRISRVYELDSEKVLDLALITFFGGMLGARIYFVALNFSSFSSFWQMLLINRYPGLSFWGGLMGGFLTLWYLAKKQRENFWLLADLAAVSFLLGVLIGDVGCFLGGCAYGTVSKLPFATTVVGLVGKRLPAMLLEALLLYFVYKTLVKQVVKFHFPGKIIASFLIYLGIIKLLLEPLRGDRQFLTNTVSYGSVLSTLAIILGLVVVYSQSDRRFKSDLFLLYLVLVDSRKRSIAASKIKRNWYNQQVGFRISLTKTLHSLARGFSKIKRRLNVRSTPQ